MFKLNVLVAVCHVVAFLNTCKVALPAHGATPASSTTVPQTNQGERLHSSLASAPSKGDIGGHDNSADVGGMTMAAGEDVFLLRENKAKEASGKLQTSAESTEVAKGAEGKGELKNRLAPLAPLAPFFAFFKALAVHISFLVTYLWYSKKVVEPKAIACEEELRRKSGKDEAPSGGEVMEALKVKHPGIASGLAVMEAAVITTLIAAVTSWFISRELIAPRDKPEEPTKGSEEEQRASEVPQPESDPGEAPAA